MLQTISRVMSAFDKDQQWVPLFDDVPTLLGRWVKDIEARPGFKRAVHSDFQDCLKQITKCVSDNECASENLKTPFDVMSRHVTDLKLPSARTSASLDNRDSIEPERFLNGILASLASVDTREMNFPSAHTKQTTLVF